MSNEALMTLDGHGFYIWMSYLIGLIVFVSLVVSVKLQKQRLVKRLSREYRMQKNKQSSGKTK